MMAASCRFLPFLVSSALTLQYAMVSASGMGMGVHHLELPRGAATCGGTAEGRQCHFPFTHTNGITYTACTDVDRDGNWCYVTPDRPGSMDNRRWGYCDCTSTTVVAGSSGQNASSGVNTASNTTEESAYSESVLERSTSPTTSMAVSGRLEYYMVDDFDHNEHKKIGAVYDADGKPTWFEVDPQLKHLRPGDTVEVIVQIESGSSSVHNETSFDSPAKVVASKVISEGSQAGLYGVRHGRDNSTSTSNRRQRRTTDGVDERSVLAITVLLPEVNAVPYCDNDCIHDMWWRGTHTIDGVFDASSYGLVRFPGVLFRHEVVELPGNLSQFDGCEYDRIATMVDTILQSRLGFSTYWGYNHFAYYIPLEIQNCNWGGLAQVNGGLMYLRSSSAAVTAHEMAHNIGLNHGSSDFDDDNVQDAEYGDVTDVCGSTRIFTEMNGPHRVQLEYIPLRAIYEVPHADVLATCSSYDARGVYQWPSYTYRGNVSTTRSGLTCQGWNTMWPWSHPYTSTNYPSRGLGNHNYCRDPDGTGAPWCVTSDPNDPNLWWDFCDIDCRQEAEVFPVLSESDRCDTTPKQLDLAPLTETPDFGRNHPSIVQIARQQGGFYFISLRTASGIFDQSLVYTPSMISAVYIHYQAGETSNTHLIDWLQPGEEFREPTTGWRVRVGNFSCSNETSSIPILLDLCPTNWTAVEHESCRGSKGANYAGYRGNVSTTT